MTQCHFAAVLLIGLGSGGCHILLPLAEPPDRNDGLLDGASPEGPGSEVGPLDIFDSLPDSVVDWWSCPLNKDDGNTVLLLRLNDPQPVDAVNSSQHIATIVNAGTSQVQGPNGCGNALAFTKTNPPSYLKVEAHEDWKLSAGSLDFWVRFTGPAPDNQNVEGIISRDASGAAGGHLTVYRRCHGTITVRFQVGDTSYYRCSADNIPQDQWHHVGVNFGAPQGLELYVDGVRAVRTDQLDTCVGTPVTCGEAISAGIDGNNNAWVIGAANWQSSEETVDTVAHPLQGEVDEVRLSRIRRDFSALLSTPE